jgi:uncharacterized protein (DUF1330 family)
MLSHTFLHTPAWAARFAPTNLLHDTQGAAMVDLPESELDRLLADDTGGPVVMLNLLRFRADGGRERYMEYAARSIPIAERFGAEALYVGDGDGALVAEAGQAWDAVVLMRYPSRQAFASMVRDPEYRAGAHLRSEALTESVLQPTVAFA